MNLIWQGDYVQSVYAAAEITGYGAGAAAPPASRPRPRPSSKSLRASLDDLVARERELQCWR